MPGAVPDIPGTLLDNPAIHEFLSQRVAELCGLPPHSTKFPGAQPVSMTVKSLEMLEKMDFWVCEKSDGVRVLVFIVMNAMTGNQEVWLIDRKQRYYQVEDLHFPHWEDPDTPLTDTILDGELVIDVDPATGVETMRLYAFDCLVLHGENIMQKSLQSRFGRLRTWVAAPFDQGLKLYPEWREMAPFTILAKKQELAYHIGQVWNVHIPQLQHGHDGLIFTCAESSYVTGTDEKILKWKPPSENSIDFKAELRFPPSPHNPAEPDFQAVPTFLLYTWLGKQDYDFFDEMEMEEEEWERLKQTGEQFDDRIIEVSWDSDRGTWKYLRIRDDKEHANHKSIMEKILISIQDGVEIEALMARSDAIRTAWKAREAQRAGKPPAGGAQAPKRQGTMPPTPGGGYAAGAPGQGIIAGLKR